MPKSKAGFSKRLDLDDLPLSIQCPNDKCDDKVNFTVRDVEAKKSVECASCGSIVNLKPSE